MTLVQEEIVFGKEQIGSGLDLHILLVSRQTRHCRLASVSGIMLELARLEAFHFVLTIPMFSRVL